MCITVFKFHFSTSQSITIIISDLPHDKDGNSKRLPMYPSQKKTLFSAQVQSRQDAERGARAIGRAAAAKEEPARLCRLQPDKAGRASGKHSQFLSLIHIFLYSYNGDVMSLQITIIMTENINYKLLYIDLILLDFE